MKRFTIAVLLFLFCSKISAQQADSNDIVIGQIVKIQSEILNEERTIWVHIPEQNPLYQPSKLPVLYLLDDTGTLNGIKKINALDWLTTPEK